MEPNYHKYRIDEKIERTGYGGMDEKSILRKLRNKDEKSFREIIDLYSSYILNEDEVLDKHFSVFLLFLLSS